MAFGSRCSYPLPFTQACGLWAFAVAMLAPAPSASANTFVRIDYNLELASESLLNTVFIEVFDDRPLSRDNFLEYVDGDLYNGVIMHRLARNFVLQGGGFYEQFVAEPPPVDISLDPNATVDLDGNPATANPTVDNEFNNSPFRSNLTGTVAYAKTAAGPDSATNQWFFNLNDNSTNLDNQNGGFTVFASVVGNGMTLLNHINENLGIANLNPDIDNNGVRDSGPFYNPNDGSGVPFFNNPVSGFNEVVRIESAERVNYFGDASTTNAPSTGLSIEGDEAFIDLNANFTGPGSIVVRNTRLGTATGLTLDRRVHNRGIVAPGLQIGRLTLLRYDQYSNATLELQIAGNSASDHDQLFVPSSVADLNGVLKVELTNGFEPTLGDSFLLLSANSITDNFAELDLPTLTDTLAWDYSLTSTQVTLSVVRAGDFNRDGQVNSADYQAWQEDYGLIGIGLDSDGNLDGEIDAIDYAIWREAFAAAGGGSLASFPIPEPSSFLIALVALLAATTRQRSRG